MQWSLARLTLVIRDILFPPCCAACQVRPFVPAGDRLCQGCLESARSIEFPVCTVCGLPFYGPQGTGHTCGRCIKDPPSFDTARSVFQYQGSVRTLIHRIKYNDDGHALKALSSLSMEHVLLDHLKPDMVIPVPLHSKRLRKRGFNQSLRLARTIFPHIPLGMDILTRTLNTKPQTELSMKERLRNVRNAFEAASPLPEGVETILLLDDVYTTGATVRACAKALKRAGAKEVHVFTVARTVMVNP
ncbi:MAG: amidophosphoribosyltransferase [Deltaproteobacteria bacterium]|nr:MAG: amidophosphoribosyltransferase [Deltaproteobacteria bacterium]